MKLHLTNSTADLSRLPAGASVRKVEDYDVDMKRWVAYWEVTDGYNYFYSRSLQAVIFRFRYHQIEDRRVRITHKQKL